MGHTVQVELSEFGWSALQDEAQALGTSVEDLAAHAILYYIADLDSGRIARKLPLALGPRQPQRAHSVDPAGRSSV